MHQALRMASHDYHIVLFVDDRCVKEDSISLEVISLETLVDLRIKYLSVDQYAKAIPETLNERRGYSVPWLVV